MSKEFDDLVRLVSRLRGPQGCPWDKRQTPQSLKPFLLEETYEVLDAVNVQDPASLKDELGDLLFQVVFHAQIARERGNFSMRDVLKGVTRKMVRRHPHVYGNTRATTAEDVLARWETHKKRERAGRNRDSALDGVPRTLPALLRAQRLQSRASRAGFDWDREAPVWDKVEEELEELARARRSESRRRVKEEMGDLLFTIVNLARFLDLDAEDALRSAAGRFARRFRAVERRLKQNGRTMAETSAGELDRLWNRAKRKR